MLQGATSLVAWQEEKIFVSYLARKVANFVTCNVLSSYG